MEDRHFCEDCKRPYARDYAEWSRGFPPATATHGDYCGLDLDGLAPIEQERMESNCMQAAWSNALTAERNTRATLDELHGYVGELCQLLGANPDEVPCDVWLLRDLISQQKTALGRARLVVSALETLHERLQVRFSFMHRGTHWKENTLDPTSIVLLATKIEEGP